MRHNLDDVDWTRFTGLPVNAIDPQTLGYVAGKSILITGAGGSIGSVLATTVASLQPKHLILLDHAENGLAELQRSLGSQRDRPSTKFILGDFRDPAVLRDALQTQQVDIVFHAAACKHVPLLETNPFVAVSINALGTYTLTESVSRAAVEQLVLLSTDKAVDPVSVLGVTKRIAELIVLTAEIPAVKVLRLCNVLGSTGSVAPVFAEQIRHGGPVTITHREARRYFITVHDAVSHLLRVLSAPDAPSLWVPRIAEQQSIASLASFLMATLEAKPAVIYTGLRPGDKLTEKLWSEEEHPVRCATDPLIRLQTPLPPADQLLTQLKLLRAAVQKQSVPGLLEALQTLVPAYRPSERLLGAIRRCREAALA